MSPAKAVVSPQREPDIDEELARYGLTWEIVQNAVVEALERGGDSFLNALPSTRGTLIYHTMFGVLNNQLAPSGWIVNSKHCKMLSPEKDFYFSPKSATGVAAPQFGPPRLDLRISSLAAQALNANSDSELQGALPLEGVTKKESLAAPIRHVYLMIECVDENSVRLELGEPLNVSDSGIVDQWARRIILPTVSRAGITTSFGDEDDYEFGFGIEPR
ncbi:hypothetical protein [Corynebacterium sp. A21]|uniref:hypothetical protein n=1 Tax=Corynebacterium sp. A21 TaxID=3457318 RepID=UPI003FD196BA